MSRSSRERQLDYNAKLTEAQLQQFRAKIAAMTPAELEIAYKVHYHACGYSDMRVCSPRSVQEFVQVWKRMRHVKTKR